MKTVLLGIDLQYDFCDLKGALYVNGANEDTSRISELIERNQQSLDHIIMSMDSHQPVHVAHQVYWKNKEGKHPNLFSQILRKDIESGQWIPQYNRDVAIDYLTKLEKSGGVCTIWPPHCIIGTKGWSVDEKVFDSISRWTTETGKSYELVNKGMYQATEHYSLFKAAVEYPDVKATLLNLQLIEKLGEFDRILIVGEAADFCVANSLNDLLTYAPHLSNRIYMLTDCMSYIIPDNPSALKIFEDAKAKGVHFCLSTEI